ncbi:MAG: tetratricopeptide repeat protein [bacterium]|nr:tetratricopeptide repeat protein [bacterium]
MWSKILDRISFWALFSTIVLLPIFFLPGTSIPIETSKGLLLVFGLAITILAWFGARFSDGKIFIPMSTVLISGFLMVLSVLLSTLFSNSFNVSFFGTLFEISTLAFVLVAFLMMFFSSLIFNDTNKVRLLIKGLLLSFSILLFFQILRISMPNTLSLGIFQSKAENIFGSWNALGILASLLVVMSLFLIEFLKFKKFKNIILTIVFICSLLFLIIVNYPLVWLLLGIFSLFIFIYKIAFLSKTNEQGEKRVDFPAFSFGVVMISLLFFMSGQFIGGYVPSSLGINNTELSPSASATLNIAKSSLAHDPVFGVGPNKFSQLWSLYKIEGINTSIAWNSSFNFGFGLLPTLMLTTGILGILLWILFLSVIHTFSYKVLFSKRNIENGHIEKIVFVLLALFLFTASFLYPVGMVLFVLSFIFIGVALGLAHKKENMVLIHVFAHPKKSFFIIFSLVLAMLITAGATFKYIEKFASAYYFTRALNATEVEQVESNLNKAISLYQNDLYFRTYAQVYLSKLNIIFNKATDNNPLAVDDRNNIQKYFTQALSGANLAVSYDNKNFSNYMALAAVYETVVPFKVEGAYQNAIDAYGKALALNPLNPQIKYFMARVSFSDNKLEEAKSYALESYALKNNYVDVLILLSQIARTEGNKTEALDYARKASAILPDNQELSTYVTSLSNVPAPVPVVEDTKDSTETKKQ